MPSLTKPEPPSGMVTASAQLGIRSIHMWASYNGLATSDIKNIIAEKIGRPDGILNIISPVVAQKKSAEHSQGIFDNWNFLNHVIQRHEAIIQRRWIKKSSNKRRSLLTNIWPEITHCHRADFYHFMKGIRGDDRFASSDARRIACLWPHLNLEDLSKPESLLLMLNSRARNYPDAFINADFDACRIGLAASLAVPDYWTNDVSSLMQLVDCKTPETYGEVFQCQHSEGSCLTPKQCSEGVPVGLGLHLLHIQDWLYQFLVRCCKAILHDLPVNDLISDKFPISPEPPLPSAADQANLMDVLSVDILEAPYRLPADIHFTRLETVVAARLAAAKDHVWSMREDPGYFAEVLLDWKEHRHYCVPDEHGGSHRELSYGEDHMWDHTIHYCVGEALETIEVWDTLLRKVSKFRSLVAREAQYHCENCLEDDTLDAFVALDMDIDCFMKYFMQRTWDGFYSSPIMRPTQYRVDGILGNPEDFALRYRRPIQQGTVLHKLQFIHDYLYARNKFGRLDLGRKVFLDELELFLKKEPEAKKLFSPWASSHLADVYLFADCAEQLRLYLVSESYNRKLIREKVDALEGDELKRYPTLASLQDCAWSHGLSSFGKPISCQMRYPSDRPRTKPNTDMMIMAEKRLDYFWQDLRSSLKKKQIMSPLLADVLSQSGLRRTEAWTEPKHVPRRVVENQVESSFVVPGATHVCNLRSEISHPSRMKVKTRGTSNEPCEAVNQETDTSSTETSTCIFKVSNRALKVFKTLFYDNSRDAPQGEIPWKDFLFAMASMGFANEKLFGSVWHFQPTDETMHRSIQFHEPHPVPHLPYIMAKRYGRRLNRAFGWTGDMFELA
ncbi:hypothetical protein F5B20DRAFT_587411 [Whalleya microplaca]|nr:hypothetical protein F5B20DRAFT_587411 [Whalleya microplaca]